MGGQGVDRYFDEHSEVIIKIADLLRKEMMPVKVQPIYRGILLTPEEAKDGELEPMAYIKYLSFSQDRDVALDFARVQPYLDLMFAKQGRKGVEGYLITHTPSPSEVIFHLNWTTSLGIDKWFRQNFDDTSLLDSQKEIIIKQTMIRYKLEKVDWSKEKSTTQAAPQIF